MTRPLPAPPAVPPGRAPRWPARAWPWIALAASAACDRGNQPLSAPRQGPAPQIVATSPVNEQTGVALDAALRVRFDRFLDPTTVVRQSVRITGGTLNPDGSAVAGEAFLEPSYDMLERVAIFRLPPGGRWVPGVRYSVTLWAPGGRPGVDGGFRAWDGAALATSTALAFTTTTDTSAPPTETTPATADYCARCDGAVRRPGVSETLASACAQGSCHGASSPTGPALGLDLGTFAGVRATALSEVAHETLAGLSSTPEANPDLLGVSMPVIDPGHPGNSYLAYKLLIGDHLWDAVGSDERFPPEPVGGPLRPDPAEVARLRDIFVAGDPMPPDGQPAASALDLGQARALLSWIQDGAVAPPTEPCPPVDCGAAGSSGSSGQAGAGP